MKATKAVGIVLLGAVVLAAIGGCKAKESTGQNKPDAGPASKPALVENVGTPPATLPLPPSDNTSAKQLTLDLGNKVTMKLVLIPSGKFMMGSPKDEKVHKENQSQQHEVILSKPFYMGIYDVTQEQYEQIMGKNPSYFKGAQNPVERVTWDEAVEFCKKVSQKTGKTVSVPSESLWEYACRAGSKARFSYGNDYDKLGDYAWYGKNSQGKTHPVGQKKPNAWGLYDMHGNVSQWCSDCYTGDFSNAIKTDPTGPDSGEFRVLRGGSWVINDPWFCCSACRLWYGPDYRSVVGNNMGFRVVAAGAAGVD